MSEENVQPKYTHGEPINLTLPAPEVNLVDKSLKVFSDQTVMNRYENDPEMPADNLADSDLQRAVRMARLDKMKESKTLSGIDNDLQSYDENIKNRGWFEKLYDLTHVNNSVRMCMEIV